MPMDYYPGSDTEPDDNYLSKLAQMEAEGKLPRGPGLSHVLVLHDSWCGALRGKRCDCDPDIRFVDDATWQHKHGGKA
jgi:hypothetical protein